MCDVPVPIQFTSFHCSQVVFIQSDGVSSSGFHFLIGYVISIRDTKEFAETSHTEIEGANPTCYLTQSQYTDTRLTIPNTDPISPGLWLGIL